MLSRLPNVDFISTWNHELPLHEDLKNNCRVPEAETEWTDRRLAEIIPALNDNQYKAIYRECLWIGDIVKYTEDTIKNTDLHQQMPATNFTSEVDKQSIQYHTLENDQATTHKNEIKKKNGGE